LHILKYKTKTKPEMVSGSGVLTKRGGTGKSSQGGNVSTRPREKLRQSLV